MAYNPYHHSPFTLARIAIIGGFCLAAYMLYSLTVSIYENYQIDAHIKKFEEKNQLLAEGNQEKMESYQYYTSQAYIEKIAKQNLGLIKPGEEIIILPSEDTLSILESEEEKKATEAQRQKWSNPKKWWKFIFDENPFKY